LKQKSQKMATKIKKCIKFMCLRFQCTCQSQIRCTLLCIPCLLYVPFFPNSTFFLHNADTVTLCTLSAHKTFCVIMKAPLESVNVLPIVRMCSKKYQWFRLLSAFCSKVLDKHLPKSCHSFCSRKDPQRRLHGLCRLYIQHWLGPLAN